MHSGDRTVSSKHMNHADTGAHNLRENSRLRQRKQKDCLSDKMVGSGIEKLLVHDFEKVRMELEVNSEDESMAEDTHRLITTPIPDVSNEGSNLNSIKRISDADEEDADQDENVWSISIQMFIPFLLAGFGMVAASLLLDVVQVRNHSPELELVSSKRILSFFNYHVTNIFL